MSEGARAKEEAAVKLLRGRYERDGYQFFEYPPRDLVPPFLGSYQPDALAIGPNGNEIIEVRSGEARPGRALLSELARRVEAHKDWRLRIVYLGEVDEADADGPTPAASSTELRRALDEAKQLAQDGRLRPAFAIAWSVLEGAARNILPSGRTARAPTPRELAEGLVAQGHLGQTAGRRLRQLIAVRNAVVHGDFSTDVRADDLQALIDLVSALLRDLPEARASH
jgi:hypothetical protein